MTTANKGISITKQLDLGIEDIIAGMASLDTPELERFMQRIGQIVALRKTPAASERETTLLMAINQPIPQKLQERYTELAQKLEDETMTPDENKEFIKLTEKMEAKQVKRLEFLIELSRLRGVSLNTLMQQLHLNLPNVE